MDLMAFSLFITGVILTTVLTLWIVLKLLIPNDREEKQGCIRWNAEGEEMYRNTWWLFTVFSVCMVLGSGGHTTEMVALSRALDRKIYTPRTYIIAETDQLSKMKIEKEESGRDDDVRLITIPRQYYFSSNHFYIWEYSSGRSREVGQSYLSSISTTVQAFIGSFQPILKTRPHLLLVNGPGM